jgi:hypothetical protein
VRFILCMGAHRHNIVRISSNRAVVLTPTTSSPTNTQHKTDGPDYTNKNQRGSRTSQSESSVSDSIDVFPPYRYEFYFFKKINKKHFPFYLSIAVGKSNNQCHDIIPYQICKLLIFYLALQNRKFQLNLRRAVIYH